MRSVRFSSLSLLALAAACGGTPATRGPLFMASPAPGTAVGTGVTIQVVDNTVSVSGSLEGGCRPASGEYRIEGRTIEIQLGEPASTSCAGGEPAGGFTTRVGPLSPGGYKVTVKIGNRTVVSSQSIRVG